MYLSRIELNTRRKDTVLRFLASPQVAHAAVENCFTRPEGEQKTRTLWRIDELRGKTYLIILSVDTPDFTRLAAEFGYEGDTGEIRDYSKLLASVKVGNVYSFKLEANPTKGVQDKKLALYTQKEQMDWFVRKAESCGFEVDAEQVRVSPVDKLEFSRKNTKSDVVIAKVRFDGRLRVTDAEVFVNALTKGIGRARAYGCGLLTVVPR